MAAVINSTRVTLRPCQALDHASNRSGSPKVPGAAARAGLAAWEMVACGADARGPRDAGKGNTSEFGLCKYR